MKMDRAIPVEVARFRTKEGLVYREVCGAQLFGSGRNRRPREGLRFFCFSGTHLVSPTGLRGDHDPPVVVHDDALDQVLSVGPRNLST